MKPPAFLAAAPLLAAIVFAGPAGGEEHDLVIYGGTSAGVAAAVQATRLGKSVLLIEPGSRLGGLSSGGLGMTDSGRKEAIGGISREFYQRVQAHYQDPAAWEHETPEEFNATGGGRFDPGADAMWVFEPRVAERIFREMAEECGDLLTLAWGQRLDRETGVTSREGRVLSIAMESGEVHAGRMFLDATYEGDLMAAAGVDYHVGREANTLYGETLNGVQKARNVKNHRFLVPVDPWLIPGDPSSGLLPEIHGDPPGEEGEGDARVQAYCFRMCLSRVPSNRLPFPRPEDYDERRYELLLRNFEAGDLRLPLSIAMMPNGKTDTNNNGAFSTDYLGGADAYPEASHAEREAIIRDHESYQKGLMWTLANHSRVPAPVREEMSGWGLAADEFLDTGGWGHQLYIREARRMVGDYVVTELDCRRERICPDPVGLGSYNMDSHNTQRYVTPEGTAQNEGDVQVSPGGSYAISYRAIVPRKGQAANLFVPVALSASHIAYGSIRMEPVFMILGQSAAAAASLAIDAGVAAQEVDYAALRALLLEGGQVIDLPPGAGPLRRIEAAALSGVAVDDEDAALEGEWSWSSSNRPYVGEGYRHDGHAPGIRRAARYAAELPRAGRYEVRVSYSAAGNRATNVPVTVIHRGGRGTLRVNQRETPEHEGLFRSLGTWEFDAGPAAVVISNEGADGHVVIDAVQWLPAKPGISRD